jgi:hypothetical protein
MVEMKQMFEVGVFGFRNDAPLVNELVPVIHSKALARVAIMNTKRERGRACWSLFRTSH